jgi:hypothetical protein
MPSRLALKNGLNKTLTIKNSDQLASNKEVIYLDTVAQLSSASGTNGDVAHVSELSKGGSFTHDGISFVRQSVLVASTTKLWSLEVDDSGVITTSEVV